MSAAISKIWQIGAPQLIGNAVCSRVVATVEGEPIWFESPDLELLPAPEAFTSLFLVPALLAAANIEIDAPLDVEWLQQARRIPPLLHDWWGCKNRFPLPEPVTHKSTAGPNNFRALCFTAGVDSMYAFLRDMAEIDALLFVHGFDIPVADTVRMDAFEQAFRAIAAQMNKRAILVRTNAREHSLFRKYSWEKTHGGGLAAVGQVLTGTVGQLRIASSWPYFNNQPWGSHWELDPLFSGSRLQVEHADASLSRQQKIRQIASEPLAQQHLRVCWENLSASGNCCRCAKCVRTMLSLHVAGTLDKFPTFEPGVNLAERLDAIPYLAADLHGPGRAQLGDITDPELHAAMTRLLARQPSRGLVKSIKHWLRHGRQ